LNEFSVKIPENWDATEIAQKYGFINLGKVGKLKNWYIFSDPRIRKRSLDNSNRNSNSRNLRSDPRVESVNRQKLLKRVKRDFAPLKQNSNQNTSETINDPHWEEMWYLHCDDDEKGCQASMRVTDAWKAGYHGENVVITILDDGIESTHPDLRANYDPLASIDINDKDANPLPRYDTTNENKHGTRCAGVVAATKNNFICSVGIAHEANIGGIRMLDGDVTDSVEASSLNYNFHYISIYSASWGPDDDGKTVEGPGPLAKRALQTGASEGREGKGSIFVWASGNGGSNQDSCACDGYINSIYTIGVSSISENGLRPWYLEACSSTIAATYSSGEQEEGKVVTTDLHSSCTNHHTGTSASAPMASAIIALMLQANSELTWRDVQHIIVRTASSTNLKAPDWTVNGAGFNVSHVFGYGLMNAVAMTTVAKGWKRVPEQNECFSKTDGQIRDIMGKQTLVVEMGTNGCYGNSDQVSFLEHVVLKISLRHSKRGDLQIFLTSPAGTRSEILHRRTFDRSRDGFNKWEFMTTHHWGENPMGTWILEIEDQGFKRIVRYTSGGVIRGNGLLNEWQLKFYGTKQPPQPGFSYDNCDDYPQNLCHSECADGCCGEKPSQCKSCKHAKNIKGECVISCQENEYEDPSTNICMPCSPRCKTCNLTSQYCTSCPSNYRLTRRGVCELTCRDGYYVNPSSQSCRRCQDSCTTCQGRRNNCLSCQNGYRLVNGRCETKCSSGEYLASRKGQCKRCGLGCEHCRSGNRCLLCQEGYYLYHNRRCQRSCGARYYVEESTRRCRPCFPKCATCNGRFYDQCTSCYSKHVLDNGKCVARHQNKCVDVETRHPERCKYVVLSERCFFASWRFQCCASCAKHEAQQKQLATTQPTG